MTTPKKEEKRRQLGAEEASLLAISLANQKAHKLFEREPFKPGEKAISIHGRWEWTAKAGYGLGDIQAQVSFAADGSDAKVDVSLLDSRPDP